MVPSRNSWAKLGEALCIAGAAAILLGSGPSSGSVRAGLLLGVAGILCTWSTARHLPGIGIALALVAWTLGSIAWLHANVPTAEVSSPLILLIPCAVYIGIIAWRSLVAGLWLDRTALLMLVATLGLMAVQLAVGWNRDDGTRWHVDPAGQRWGKATGCFHNHIEAGLLLSSLSFLALTPRGRGAVGRIGSWILPVLGFVGVVFTSSRTTFAAFGAGVFTFYGIRSWRTFGIICVLLASLLGVHYVHQRITRPEVITNSLKFQDGRWPLWTTELDMIRQAPWFGAGGAKQFKAISKEQFPVSCPGQNPEFPEGIPNAHNAFLGYASYFGVPALGLWLIWLGVLAVALVRRLALDRENAYAGLALLATFLVGGMGDMLPISLGATAATYLLLGSCLARRDQPPSTLR